MNASDHEILDTLASRLRQRFSDARIWAFGSRARDDARPESDLDVCVVVGHLTPEVRREISDLAWEVGFAKDMLISTVVFSAADFNEGPQSISPLVRSILREGVAA